MYKWYMSIPKPLATRYRRRAADCEQLLSRTLTARLPTGRKHRTAVAESAGFANCLFPFLRLEN